MRRIKRTGLRDEEGLEPGILDAVRHEGDVLVRGGGRGGGRGR